MRNRVQSSVSELLASDACPIQEWVARLELLVPLLYPHDSALARALELALVDLSSSAADFDCIGTDDPLAPSPDAAADAALSYLFKRFPDTRKNFQRLISRADQLIGRAALLDVVACAHLARR